MIVLRGGAETLEVLLVKRNPEQRFMGGAWVFPGGAVDAGEDHRVAGVREVEEEASVVIDDADSLVEFSRWITPRQVKIRFDTHFYLAPAPDGAEPRPDGGETVDLGWFTPAGRDRGLRARGDRARVPDDQDARAARAVRVGRARSSSGRAAARSCRSSRRWSSRARSRASCCPGEPGYVA